MLTWSLVTLFSTDKCLAAIMNATVGECLQKTSAFLHQVKIKLTVQAMTVLSSAKKSINLNLAYLSILRNFFAFSFVVGLLFMHKGCASAVQSLWQVLWVPIQSVFLKFSLNIIIPELLQRALSASQDKGKQLGTDRYRSYNKHWPLMISHKN